MNSIVIGQRVLLSTHVVRDNVQTGRGIVTITKSASTPPLQVQYFTAVFLRNIMKLLFILNSNFMVIWSNSTSDREQHI